MISNKSVFFLLLFVSAVDGCRGKYAGALNETAQRVSRTGEDIPNCFYEMVTNITVCSFAVCLPISLPRLPPYRIRNPFVKHAGVMRLLISFQES